MGESTLSHELEEGLRIQLLERRKSLSAIPGLGRLQSYRVLLQEVDEALERLEGGRFGTCEACHEEIEPERLVGDPLIRVCLGCLSEAQQRDLERDLETAATVQQALLPPRRVEVGGWQIEYRYRPHGPVSGDYCDVLGADRSDAPTYVILGDVSGKGVSASILMAHLQAVFRSLVSLELPVSELAKRANRIFCEGILSNAFSTLLLGKLSPDGALALCNAGHCPPMLVQGRQVTPLTATGLPLGLFCETEFEVCRHDLRPGDTLFLYSDGLSEATNVSGEQYGLQRVEGIARRLNESAPGNGALQSCLDDVDRFRGKAAGSDDLTVMMIRRDA